MSAKFRIPELAQSVVVRPRLLNRLTAGVQGPITLMIAPGGCGKTVAVSSWIAAGCWPGPITWITLDADDDRPAVFWSYVLAGLARGGVRLPAVGVPDRTEAVNRSFLIRLSAGLSELREPCVLVLDRADHLTNPRLMEQLDFVIGHAAPQLRVVVITRANQGLPLHRYRLAGLVTEIDINQLAFSLSEIRELLNESAVVLSEDGLLDLSERTRGWAAGLRMAVMSIGDGVDGDEVVRRFDGNRLDVAGYFLAEVLRATSSSTREFLLRSSIVDEIDPDLAVAVTGRHDARHILASMAHAGTFIEALHGGRSYRYHPLFRELLLTQIRDELPAEVASLHGKAAKWYARAGHLDLAVHHAATKAGDWALAAQLVVGHLGIAQLLVDARPSRLANSLAGMPHDLPGGEPAVVAAALALTRLDHEACTKHLTRAEEMVDEGPARRTATIRLAIAVVQVLLSRSRADVVGATAAATAAETLMIELEVDVVVPAQVRALVQWGRGGAELRAGQVAAAETSFAAAARNSDIAGCERLRLDCLGHQALIHALCGRLRRASAVVKMATATAESCDPPGADLPASIDVARAWISTEECDVPAALAHAERAAAAATPTTATGDPVLAAALALMRARLLRMRGDYSAAGDMLRTARTGTPTMPAPLWLNQTLVAAETSLAITAGRREAAPGTAAHPDPPANATTLAWATLERHDNTRTIERATEDLQDEDLPLDTRVDAWLLTAAGRLAQGRPQLARTAIEQGLRLAEPEQLRRPILEAPPAVRQFMRHNAQLADKHPWLSANTPTAARGHRPTKPAAPKLLQPLTDREREVLDLLAALLSTEEIAKNLFISMNTVRTHIRGILRKLSATRRNEAVRRAQEFGLI